MTKTQAREYGEKAYKEGKTAAPAMDKDFLSEYDRTKSGRFGEITELLEEWNQGWFSEYKREHGHN